MKYEFIMTSGEKYIEEDDYKSLDYAVQKIGKKIKDFNFIQLGDKNQAILLNTKNI